jgi:hypothetical protein
MWISGGRGVGGRRGGRIGCAQGTMNRGIGKRARMGVYVRSRVSGKANPMLHACRICRERRHVMIAHINSHCAESSLARPSKGLLGQSQRSLSLSHCLSAAPLSLSLSISLSLSVCVCVCVHVCVCVCMCVSVCLSACCRLKLGQGTPNPLPQFRGRETRRSGH